MERQPIKVFFSYSREDKPLRDKLEIHLSSLRQQGVISSWHDRQIVAGSEWEEEIDRHMRTADIILLLVSPDFVNSKYCYDIELPDAMRRHEARSLCGANLAASSSKVEEFALCQASNLSQWGSTCNAVGNEDDAFEDVAEGIAVAVEKLLEERRKADPVKQDRQPLTIQEALAKLETEHERLGSEQGRQNQVEQTRQENQPSRAQAEELVRLETERVKQEKEEQIKKEKQVQLEEQTQPQALVLEGFRGNTDLESTSLISASGRTGGKKPMLIGGGIIAVAIFLNGLRLDSFQSSQPPAVSPSVIAPSPSATATTTPSSASEVLFKQGREKWLKGDNKDAIADFDQAIKINPDYSAAYNGRGASRSNLGENEAAIADYDKAIEVNKNWEHLGLYVAYGNRGVSHFALGENEAAIADHDQAIKLNPNYALAFHNRGDVRSKLGEHQAAIADFDQAIKLNSNFAPSYFKRGLTHYNLDDNKAAIADYDQAIKLEPDDAAAFYNRGLTHYNLDDNKAAIADYDQAIKLKPDYADAFYSRGNARSVLGNKQAAIADFQKAVDLYKQQGNDEWRQNALNRLKELQ